VRLIAAWCELRNDFRHFRTDRVVEAGFLEERYPGRPSVLRAEWKKTLVQRHRERDQAKP
jgi:predicted DNA-binding transcriptional regulator YafY